MRFRRNRKSHTEPPVSFAANLRRSAHEVEQRCDAGERLANQEQVDLPTRNAQRVGGWEFAIIALTLLIMS